jgi:hypothetical protein
LVCGVRSFLDAGNSIAVMGGCGGRNAVTNAQEAANVQRGEARGSRPSLLCVAYAFAPMARSGTHRTLAYVRHVDRLGWDTTVITVRPKGEPVDAALATRVPPATRVVRTSWAPLTQQAKDLISALRPGGVPPSGTRSTDNVLGEPASKNEGKGLRDWASRLLLTPDSRLGWVLPAWRAAQQEFQRQRPTAIYSTSPYGSAHLVGLLASQWGRLPWIADFRDPWGGNPFRDRPYRSIDWWDAWLERRVCRAATRLVCNTSAMRDELIRRLPWTAAKSVTLPNGFDSDWIDQVSACRIMGPGKFVFVHWGTCYGPRSPVPLLRALRLLADRSSGLARRVRVQFVGDESYAGEPIRAIAERYEVAAMVDVLGVWPHRDTIALARGGNASLVIGVPGPGGALQVPNKLYEALALRKPILALAPMDSAIARVLADAEADNLVCDPEDPEHIALGLAMMAERGGGFVENPWSNVAAYDRRRITAEFGDMLAAITMPLGGRKRRPPVERRRAAGGSGNPLSEAISSC